MQESVYFKNKGQLVCGTLHVPAGKRRCGAVLCCHGFTVDRNESHFLFARLARRLEEAGIASLRIDFRGSGESEGRFEDMTPLEEVSDARAAIARLRADKRIDRNRIGIVGMSLGGMVAALTAGREPKLSSVVIWGAVARPVKVIRSLAPRGAMKAMTRDGRVDMWGLYVGKAFWEVSSKLDPPAELAKSKAPVLIIHGTADTTVPYVNSTDYLRAARSRGIRADRLSISGADHGFSSVFWIESVIDATVEWFKETLL
jgi:uncharacterized protein